MCNSRGAVVARPATVNGDVSVVCALAIDPASKVPERHHSHRAERIAAPTARMVNTAQVRSGHLGSASGSHSGSDMASPAPCGACMSDTSIAKVWIRHPLSADIACELRMLISFSNARDGCTRVGAEGV
jgi:hypothetical protein